MVHSFKLNIKFSSISIAFVLLSISSLANASTNGDRHFISSDTLITPCPLEWQDAIYGYCLGALMSYDIDDDGKEELIARSSNYWHISEYDPETNQYHQIFTSEPYASSFLRVLYLADIDGNGKKELLIAEEKTLHIFNLTTLTTDTSISFRNQFYVDIYDLDFADGDNDGVKEIIISSKDKLIFLHPGTFEIEQVFEIDGTGNFSVGNVTGGPELEIVFFHGLTIEIRGEEIINELDFWPNEDALGGGLIELADVDEDNYLEAAVTDGIYDIFIFDVDEQWHKHTIVTESNITVMRVIDMDLDGVKELFVGDGSWGYVRCYNMETGNLLWKVESLQPGVSGICMGDLDGDGERELSYGGSCDVLHVYSLESEAYEWSSDFVLGPFYALEIADVDQDGNEELISISRRVDNRYGGRLSVFDLNTKEVEYRSKNDLFRDAYETYNLEVNDYANDGDLDIIVANRSIRGGKFWVIDGDEFNLEKTIEVETDSDDFYSLDVADIDGDDTLEFIAAGERKIYSINSLNFNVDWKSEIIGQTFTPYELLTGDIDGDSKAEIVFCKGLITVFDNEYSELAVTREDNYTAIRLYDWDQDGVDEILAGNQDGDVKVLDDSTLDVIDSFKIKSLWINGIEVADLDQSGEEELIVSTDKRVYFLDRKGNLMSTKVLGEDVGKYDAIEISDYDNDGFYSVFLGSNYRVIELNSSCARCLPFKVDFRTVDNTCDNESGKIIVKSPDTSTRYSWRGTSFEDTLQNLGEGTYTISARNSKNCEILAELKIYTPPKLEVELKVIEDDTLSPGIDGSIQANANGGTPPYQYTWDNGQDTSFIDQLQPGMYTLTIKDSNQCAIDTTIVIPRDTTLLNDEVVQLYPNPSKGSFFVLNNGEQEIDNMQIYSLSGVSVPFLISDTDYSWKKMISLSNAFTGYYIFEYTINGVKQHQSFIIAK